MPHDADTHCLEHNAVTLSPWAGDGVLGIVKAHSQYVQGAGEDLQWEVEQSDSEAWWGEGQSRPLQWCLFKYLLGWARPPCSACQSRVYLVHFSLACESPLCEVKTPRAPVVWRGGASFGKQGRKLNVSKLRSVANWVVRFSDSLSQQASADAQLSNPAKKNNHGMTGREYNCGLQGARLHI